jgi:hypothetical protein
MLLLSVVEGGMELAYYNIVGLRALDPHTLVTLVLL